MQFKIPQDVDLEDRILPFLTMRQLIVLVIGGWIAWLIFYTLASKHYTAQVWGPIIFFICLLTICIAYVTIDHLPFHRWVAIALYRSVVPQKRYWNNTFSWEMYFDALTSNKEKKPETKPEVTEDKKKDEASLEEIVNNFWLK